MMGWCLLDQGNLGVKKLVVLSDTTVQSVDDRTKLDIRPLYVALRHVAYITHKTIF